LLRQLADVLIVEMLNLMVNNMKSQQKHLIREQLPKTVGRFESISSVQRPVGGGA